jgi:hypothetical protein
MIVKHALLATTTSMTGAFFEQLLSHWVVLEVCMEPEGQQRNFRSQQLTPSWASSIKPIY